MVDKIKKRLRIGIDCHVIDGLFQGSRSHVLELFSHIIGQSPDMEFYLFLDRPELLRTYAPEYSMPNVHLIRMRHTNPVTRLCVQLLRLQIQYKLDIIHTQYILPLALVASGIVTIHDVLFEDYPRYFTVLFRLRSKIMMRLSAYRASHVFTVSDYSKRALLDKYGLGRDMVSVIHNAADIKKYYPGLDGIEIVGRRGLTSRGYILSVGRLEPRKNYQTLIRAYAKMKDITLPLVIIGQRHYGFQTIFKIISDLGLREKVLIIENIKDDELPALYRHARLFVYPTYAEGFGMPLLEAMASGVPIVTSNTTSIPEVVGEAGLLFDPDDTKSLVRSIRAVLIDDQLSQKLSTLGTERSAKFKWELSAQIVRNVYKLTINNRRQ